MSKIIKIYAKPLSINDAWKGRRYKTGEYKAYEALVFCELPLPKDVEIPEGPLEIRFEFGISNKCADWDNPIKPFQDILQKRYGFDDRRVFRGTAEKVIVPKGQEYVKFEIRSYGK